MRAGAARFRRILERGGVIGLNLFKRFIATGLFAGQRPSVARAIAHVRHICDIAASVPSVVDPRRHVALGSDMDGGLSAHELPEGINSPSDLGLLLEALAAEGWNEAALFDFTCGNWVRLLNRVLTVRAGGILVRQVGQSMRMLKERRMRKRRVHARTSSKTCFDH